MLAQTYNTNATHVVRRLEARNPVFSLNLTRTQLLVCTVQSARCSVDYCIPNTVRHTGQVLVLAAT